MHVCMCMYLHIHNMHMHMHMHMHMCLSNGCAKRVPLDSCTSRGASHRPTVHKQQKQGHTAPPLRG